MKRTRMTNYDKAHAAFEWSLPDSFNFGGDVIDAIAEDPGRLALIWCDGAGAERRFTFADIRRLSNREDPRQNIDCRRTGRHEVGSEHHTTDALGWSWNGCRVSHASRTPRR